MHTVQDMRQSLPPRERQPDERHAFVAPRLRDVHGVRHLVPCRSHALRSRLVERWSPASSRRDGDGNDGEGMSAADLGARVQHWVSQAQGGDTRAVEKIVKATQDNVFNLCLRMLGSPADAEDATQEILIKMITRLGSFRFQSAFSTWVYRITANHLFDMKRKASKRRAVSLEEMPERALAVPTNAERQVMEEESRRECMKATLVCLGNDFRLVPGWQYVGIFSSG